MGMKQDVCARCLREYEPKKRVLFFRNRYDQGN